MAAYADRDTQGRERERRFERGREKQTMVEALDTQLQLMGSNQKPWDDAVPRRRQVCEAGDTHTHTHTHIAMKWQVGT